MSPVHNMVEHPSYNVTDGRPSRDKGRRNRGSMKQRKRNRYGVIAVITGSYPVLANL
jgi:hypothetical protein